MDDGPDVGPAPRLEVGRIGRPHGLRGEVTVHAVTNRPERFAPGSVLHDGERELVVVTGRPHQGGWLVRFEGVVDRDGAEALRGTVLSAAPLGPLPDDEVWVHELIGCVVTERDGRARGTVASVQDNPAHELLVLDDGTLVPVVFVVEHVAGRLVVDAPLGIFPGDDATDDADDTPDGTG